MDVKLAGRCGKRVMSSIIIKNNLAVLDEAIKRALNKGIQDAALLLEAKITEKVAEGSIPPPLKPETIRKKGSSATLIDTGELLGQITHKFDEPNVAKVGIFGSRAPIAAIHEFGAPDANIPERSFLRSTTNNAEDRAPMNKVVIETLRDAVKRSTVN